MESLIDLDRAESRRRLRFLNLIAATYAVAVLGIALDIQWHLDVGRDAFVTLSHVVLYGGIGLSGMISLGFILSTTIRSWSGDPALNRSTVMTIRRISAPPPLFVAVFGGLVCTLSAPLDNYWHLIYGVDLALWTPFHTMGILGGIIAFLSMIALAGDEVRRARARNDAPAPAQIVGAVISGLLVITIYLYLGDGLWIGGGGWWSMMGIPVAGYLIVATFAIPIALLGSRRLLDHPFALTGIALVAQIFTLIFALVVPEIVELYRAGRGFVYRPGAPSGAYVLRHVHLLLTPICLIADVTAIYLARQGGTETRSAVTAGLIVVVGVFLHSWWTFMILSPLPTDILFTALLALVAGALGLLLSSNLGRALVIMPRWRPS